LWENPTTTTGERCSPKKGKSEIGKPGGAANNGKLLQGKGETLALTPFSPPIADPKDLVQKTTLKKKETVNRRKHDQPRIPEGKLLCRERRNHFVEIEVWERLLKKRKTGVNLLLLKTHRLRR